MIKRPNRATITDSGLGEAFAQGVNEGFRLTGYVTVFCRVGKGGVVRKEMAVADVPEYINEFLLSLRGEHYEVGVEIRILSEGDVKPEPKQAEVAAISQGEDIEEAEIVAE